MRRQGQYADSSVSPYVAQMQHMSNQRMDRRSGHFQGRLQGLSSEKEHVYSSAKEEGEWGWEGEPMSPHMYTTEGQSGDISRSFYQGQRLNPDTGFETEKKVNNESRTQPHEEEMDIGYEVKASMHTFEDLEQKFLDDITKLTKEQSDAEDAENARHREKINTINAQYQEQLTALRSRHATRRDDLLRRESHARQRQYQQTIVDHYSSSGTGPCDLRSYGGVPAAPPVEENPHAYRSNDHVNSYRERTRVPAASRDHGFGPDSYSGGRGYDSNSRYY